MLIAESFYPFTLTMENDSTARPTVGLPIEVAGRKVVNSVSIILTCGERSLASCGLDKIR